jgi:hypothetical protein
MRLNESNIISWVNRTASQALICYQVQRESSEEFLHTESFIPKIIDQYLKNLRISIFRFLLSVCTNQISANYHLFGDMRCEDVLDDTAGDLSSYIFLVHDFIFRGEPAKVATWWDYPTGALGTPEQGREIRGDHRPEDRQSRCQLPV